MREPRTIADHSSAIFAPRSTASECGTAKKMRKGRPGGSCRAGSNLCSTTCGQATRRPSRLSEVSP
jgi:hypothetical protein